MPHGYEMNSGLAGPACDLLQAFMSPTIHHRIRVVYSQDQSIILRRNVIDNPQQISKMQELKEFRFRDSIR